MKRSTSSRNASFSPLTGGGSASPQRTRPAGRDDCPQCGHTRDLHSCKHCGWTACLPCWQDRSQYNTCPSCRRSNP